MVVEHATAHPSQWAAITSIAAKLGCSAEALRSWVRQAERDAGQRPGLTTDERARFKQLERENLYYEHKARARAPERRPARVRRNETPAPQLQRVCREHREVYGVRKVWKQLRREGYAVAQCTVVRLMRRLGLAGVVRGRRFTVTTTPGPVAARPPGSGDPAAHRRAPQPALGGRPDLRGDVAGLCLCRLRDRRVLAPDHRVASSLRSDLALDALEQALYDRALTAGPLVHHSDHGGSICRSGTRNGWTRRTSSGRWGARGTRMITPWPRR